MVEETDGVHGDGYWVRRFLFGRGVFEGFLVGTEMDWGGRVEKRGV